MARTTRRDMRGNPAASLVGQTFYDIKGVHTYSFCPDSNDASTPATQVHWEVQLAGPGAPTSPLIMRFHSPRTLDAVIEALIEHRTFVFGRREYRNDFEVQS